MQSLVDIESARKEHRARIAMRDQSIDGEFKFGAMIFSGCSLDGVSDLKEL